MIYCTIQVTIEITHFKANPVRYITINCVQPGHLSWHWITCGVRGRHGSSWITLWVIHPHTEILFYIKCIVAIKYQYLLDWCTAAHDCSKKVRVFYSQLHYKRFCIRTAKNHHILLVSLIFSAMMV